MLYSPVATHLPNSQHDPPQSPRLAIRGPRAAGPTLAQTLGTTNTAAGPCSAHAATDATHSGTTHVRSGHSGTDATNSGTTHAPAEATAGRFPAGDCEKDISPGGGLWIARRTR